MDNCIFCKIVAGELPCNKVYEDDNYLGFLDLRPLTHGNSLLITKKHYRWVYDVPNFGEYFEIVKKVALASQTVLKSESVSILTLGHEIPHAHVRIIPRFPDDQHPKGINTEINIKTPPEIRLKVANEILCQTKQM